MNGSNGARACRACGCVPLQRQVRTWPPWLSIALPLCMSPRVLYVVLEWAKQHQFAGVQAGFFICEHCRRAWVKPEFEDGDRHA